jgi:hypothetical protein
LGELRVALEMGRSLIGAYARKISTTSSRPTSFMGQPGLVVSDPAARATS